MPPPDPDTPDQPPVRLIDGRLPTRPFVPATVHRGVPPDRMPALEAAWRPARAALADRAAAGWPLEHDHWNWSKFRPSPGRPPRHLLATVEVEGETQGAIAVLLRPKPARLTPGRHVLYVDFVEVAPWNLPVEGVQTPRFGGVGTMLVAEAVRASFGRTAGGRVGLHALPSAERFYAGRCGMTAAGPDPDYYDLVYFEYPDGMTAGWLTDRGLSA